MIERDFVRRIEPDVVDQLHQGLAAIGDLEGTGQFGALARDGCLTTGAFSSVALAIVVELALLQSAEGAGNVVLHHGAVPLLAVGIGRDLFRHDDGRDRDHVPAVPPISADAVVLVRNVLLIVLGQIFMGNIVAVLHVPFDPVIRANVPSILLFRSCRDPDPGSRKDLLRFPVWWRREENMKMGDSPFLEFQDP